MRRAILRQIRKPTDIGKMNHSESTFIKAAVCGVWIAAFLFVAGFLVLAYHYIMPPLWCWLSNEQLRTLTTFMFSYAITSGGSKYLSSRLS